MHSVEEEPLRAAQSAFDKQCGLGIISVGRMPRGERGPKKGGATQLNKLVTVFGGSKREFRHVNVFPVRAYTSQLLGLQ